MIKDVADTVEMSGIIHTRAYRACKNKIRGKRKIILYKFVEVVEIAACNFVMF